MSQTNCFHLPGSHPPSSTLIHQQGTHGICGLWIRAALSLTHRCQSGNQGGLGRRATSSRKYFTLSNLEPLRTSWVCNCLQCLQSSRSQVGGSNLDSCVEETFQKTLNLWTGRSQLPPETFKFELLPVWWAVGTERHSPPPSLLAKQLLKEFVRFPISCISLL